METKNVRELELEFNLREGSKKFKISFPTVGQFYDIEAQKQLKGKGLYGSIAGTNTVTAQHAADMIDIESTLSVLCPDIMEEGKGGLRCKSFADLDLEDYVEIKRVYVERFTPWWDNILKLLKPEEK